MTYCYVRNITDRADFVIKYEVQPKTIYFLVFVTIGLFSSTDKSCQSLCFDLDCWVRSSPRTQAANTLKFILCDMG